MTENIHQGKKRFFTIATFEGLYVNTFQTVKKLVHTLVWMCPLYISREERNK